VIDFTSALYLGLEHPWASLPAWDRLTRGKPAALGSMEGASRVERELAGFVGCERVMLSPSTLHAFHDVFGMLAEPRYSVLLHEDVYPIARLAAGYRELPVAKRRSYDAIGSCVIVADGYLPFRGSSPPVEEYSDAARESGGLLVIDDTQALGILGPGGSGTLRHKGIEVEHVVVVASLAKAFGVPLAFIGGSAAFIARLKDDSFTRVHCSPPSAAVIAAAGRALEINREYGDGLRAKLSANVARLKTGLADLRLSCVPGTFPVQPLGNLADRESLAFHEILLKKGVKTVLARGSGTGGAHVVFVLRADHSFQEIDFALCALNACRSLIGAARESHSPGKSRGRR